MIIAYRGSKGWIRPVNLYAEGFSTFDRNAVTR